MESASRSNAFRSGCTEGKPSPTGRLTFTTWHHWTKDMPPLESGLLGPVRLLSAKNTLLAER